MVGLKIKGRPWICVCRASDFVALGMGVSGLGYLGLGYGPNESRGLRNPVQVSELVIQS